MVNWASLAFNGLWVLGAAVILAALSFSRYEAQRQGERWRTRLAASGFQMWFLAGLILISLGAALVGPRWWQRGLWGVFCAVNAWQLWSLWRVCKMGGD